MQHNLRTVKMHDLKIKPTLFTYRDFFIEILMERFGDDEKKKWLANNPTLTDEQIDTYIKWFDELRKSKPTAAITINIDGVPTGHDRFDISKYKDWTSFESFVDAVRAQIPMGSGKLTTQLEIDGKPLFEKNGLEVYYADTPRACIKYKGNVPYGWCIARPDSSNMFYTYRLRDNQPAFYFVKDVAATQEELSSNEKFNGKFKNKWHFFVIQVLKDAKIDDVSEKNYVVTSANNDGDEEMSWSQIVTIQPKLKGLQSEFLPKPLSSEEQAKVNKYKDGITSQEFTTLSYEEKEIFLDIYPSIGKPISDEIFDGMPHDLKNKYIGFGVGMTDKQYNIVKNDTNLLKRYIRITERKFQEWLKKSNQYKLVDSEMDVLIKYNILDKYIDKLSDANIRDLLNYSNNKQQTINVLFNKNVPLTDKNVKTLLQYSPNKQQTIEFLLSKNIPLTDHNIFMLLHYSTNKQQTIDLLLSKGLSIDKILTSDAIFDLLKKSKDPSQTIEFLLSNGLSIDKILTGDVVYYMLHYSTDKQQTIDLLLSKGLSIDKILTGDVVYSLLKKSKDPSQTIDLFLSKGGNIDKILTDNNVKTLLKYSPNKQQTIDLFLSKNISLTDKNAEVLLHYSTDKQQTIDLLLSKGLSIDKILTGDVVYSLLSNSNNLQQTIEFLLSNGLSIDKILTGDVVTTLLHYSTDKQKIIDTLLIKNVPLTDKNVENLLRSSTDKQQTIDLFLNKGLSIDKILTGHAIFDLLSSSNNEQQTIDLLLSKGLSIDKILTNDVVYSLLRNSNNLQQTIDVLLNKNVPLTDYNVRNLLKYSPNKPDTQRKIDALKAKQQLSESKFRYRDFFI